MLNRTVRSGIVIAALLVPGLVAGPAAAQSCGPAAGVGKRVNNGVTEYYEDARCGVLDRSPTAGQPKPRPATPPSGATGGEACREYPDGQLCGVGIGAPRIPLPTATWQRLYGNMPVGTVTVGPITTVGSGGGGGAGGGGTVTVGSLENIKESAETNAE